MAARTKLAFKRWPQTDDELWNFVASVWGVRIPRVAVCPDHSAPFDAFADAYFARHDPVVWKASRGFGGKSFLLATLAITEAVCLKASATILGGSGAQSQNVHEYMQDFWRLPYAPRKLLESDPTKMRTCLRNGAEVMALLASTTSVRGPHPQRLRLDEVDEMEEFIFTSALGQPMTKNGVSAQTVISSTHHYPDKMMTQVLRRAREEGWKVHQWCYRENALTEANPMGWLTAEDIEKKRLLVPKAMWDTEYELQEPSTEGRAFQTEKVESTFLKSLGEFGPDDDEVTIEEPESGVEYSTGADWAKENDWTIINTYKMKEKPWRLVCSERMRRRPWPVMIARLKDRVAKYPGPCVHDATGLGGVIEDYLAQELKPTGEVLTGQNRSSLFSEYVAALESGEFECPHIQWMYEDHKYALVTDLWGSGHPPDSIVACALAWRGRTVGLSSAKVRSITHHPKWKDNRRRNQLFRNVLGW